MPEINKKRPGDSNQITRDYLDSLCIETRYMDAVLPDTTLQLYGETFATPVMIAAFSHLDKIYKDCRNGMVEMARGACAANAVMWAGMGDEEEMKGMTETGAKVIKIIKPYADSTLIFRQIKEAQQYGAIAVGMDIDHSFNGAGAYDKVGEYEMRAQTTQMLKSYVDATTLPFIVKGVLSVHDAQRCMAAGVKGIVVSHHHGISDFAIPPLKILPEIVKAVNGAFPIFVDCGIERGFDAFKALALGAAAVSVSRDIIADLIEEGHAGVTARIETMTRELAGVMARTSSPRITQIDPKIIWQK